MTFLVTLLCSIQDIEVNYAGLLKNEYNFEVDTTKVWEAGRHWPGPGRSFYLYPLTQQVMDFGGESEEGSNAGVAVTSSTGQAIYLEVSLQYRIPKENIPWVWARFKREYYGEWIRKTAVSVIASTASRFETLDFYQKRRELSTKIQENLAVELNFEGKGFLLSEVQLKMIKLPKLINDQNVENVVTYQQRNLAQYLQNAIVETSQIKVITAQARADASVIIMDKQAAGYLEYEKMRGIMAEWYTESEVNGYKRLSTGLGVLTQDQILYKQWMDTWMNVDSDALLINVNKQAVLAGGVI